MQGVLWHVRCTVTAFPQVPPPPTVFSLQVSVWLDSSFLLRLHSLYGEKSRRFSSTHPYQELCANQAPFLLCGRWWQGKGSGRTTGWLKMLTSAWHQVLARLSTCIGFFHKLKSLLVHRYSGVTRRISDSRGGLSKYVYWPLADRSSLFSSSHRKKREAKIKREIKKGIREANTEDPFELFISVTDIRYTYYKETHKILGNTYGMCILQDFEAITPNTLARTIETVEGGGMVVLLLKSMSSLKQLYTMTMVSWQGWHPFQSWYWCIRIDL